MTENGNYSGFNSETLKVKQEEEDEIDYYITLAPNDVEENTIADAEPVTSFTWTTEATVCLIMQYKKFRSLVGQSTRIRNLRDMFEIISNEMKKQNFFFSPQKCENKWRVLERKYKELEVRKKMNMPGRIKDFHNWKHKKAMDEIFKSNLKVLPVDSKLCELIDNAVNVTAPGEKPINNEVRKPATDTVINDNDDRLTAIIKNGFAEFARKIREADLNKERRHQERMKVEREKLEVQKKLLNLKMKKLEVLRTNMLATARQLNLS